MHAALVLTQCKPTFPLSQVVAHQSIMCFFQTIINHQNMLPMGGTLIKLFAPPGNTRKHLVRLDIHLPQFVATQTTPITVEWQKIISSIELHNGTEQAIGSVLIFTIHSYLSGPILLTENGYIIPDTCSIHSTQIKRIALSARNNCSFTQRFA